jgi:hypothetical protein
MENPSHWAFSTCKRPPRLQYDDWSFVVNGEDPKSLDE